MQVKVYAEHSYSHNKCSKIYQNVQKLAQSDESKIMQAKRRLYSERIASRFSYLTIIIDSLSIMFCQN